MEDISISPINLSNYFYYFIKECENTLKNFYICYFYLNNLLKNGYAITFKINSLAKYLLTF